MSERDKVRKRLKEDGIEFILVQFVDVHGAAKVKMVPASCLDDVTDVVDSLAKPCYDYRSMAPAMAYLQDVTTTLNRLGWGVYQTDHEDANSQYEANFQYADALTTADRVTFFRMAVSQIARKHGAI